MTPYPPITPTRTKTRPVPRWMVLALGLILPASAAAADTEPSQETVPLKVIRYAERLLRRYDGNGDGQLQQDEWSRMRGDPAGADLNQDGLIAQDELVQHVADYGRGRRIRPLRRALKTIDLAPLLAETIEADSPDADAAAESPPEDAEKPAGEETRRELKYFVPLGRLPEGLPNWFVRRDADGDGQLTLAEFAPKATRTQLDQFTDYDANGDGVITAKECLRGAKPAAKESAP